MKYQEALKEGEKLLLDNKITDYKTDAWLLLSMVTGFSRSGYILAMTDEMKEEEYFLYKEALQKRSQRIPLQHITGEQDFMGLTFKVNEHVLIPRQDTESLVEEALKVLKPKSSVLDLCTGSGCIVISIVALGEEVKGTGVDISKEALLVARDNADRLAPSVKLMQGDVLEKIDGRFDCIVSNPPYIRPEVIETLEPEVKEHEPRIALDGSADGLVFYRRISMEAPSHLNEGGWLLFEIGYDQGQEVFDLLVENGFKDVQVIKDLNGNDRVVKGHL